MSCNQTSRYGCNDNVKNFGAFDLSRIHIDGSDRTQLNWTELSIPEIMTVPEEKPDIEQLDQVYVDATITSAKLIETPYAFQTYQRQATAYELTTATAAVAAAVVDLDPIVDAVNAILSVPLLPAIPQVTALQKALADMVTAGTNLTSAITDADIVLALPCVAAITVVDALKAVHAAVTLLQAALTALIAAANALADVVASIPVVGPAVAAAVALLLTAVDVVVNALLDSVTALLGAITLIGTTTYFALGPNAEGTCLSGRKLIIEGVLKQKVVYTGLVPSQSVHSVHNEVPFTAYVIPYAKFVGIEPEENITVIADAEGAPCETITITGYPYDPEHLPTVDLCEEFCVNGYVEDIFAYAMDCRTIFKNVTLFLHAKPSTIC